MAKNGKSFWLRRERYRWLANCAGLLGAALALLIVGLAIADDVQGNHDVGAGVLAVGVAMLALGFYLPRYVVMNVWRTKLRSRLEV